MPKTRTAPKGNGRARGKGKTSKRRNVETSEGEPEASAALPLRGPGQRGWKPVEAGTVNVGRKPPETIDFQTFVETVTLVDRLVDAGHGDVERPCGSDLGTYIHNQGDDSECAEALMALAPIAQRIYDRECAAKQAASPADD